MVSLKLSVRAKLVVSTAISQKYDNIGADSFEIPSYAMCTGQCTLYSFSFVAEDLLEQLGWPVGAVSRVSRLSSC